MNPHPFLELIPLQAAPPPAQRARSSSVEAAQDPAAAEGDFLAHVEGETCASADGAGASPLAAGAARGKETPDTERIFSSDPTPLHAVALGQEGVAFPPAVLYGLDVAGGDPARVDAQSEEISDTEQQGLGAGMLASGVLQVKAAQSLPVAVNGTPAPPPPDTADSTASASPGAAGVSVENNGAAAPPGAVAPPATASEVTRKAQESLRFGSATESPPAHHMSKGESAAEAIGQQGSAARETAPTGVAAAKATGGATTVVASGPSVTHAAFRRDTGASVMAQLLSAAQGFAPGAEQTADPILAVAPQTDFASAPHANVAAIPAGFAAQGTASVSALTAGTPAESLAVVLATEVSSAVSAGPQSSAGADVAVRLVSSSQPGATATRTPPVFPTSMAASRIAAAFVAGGTGTMQAAESPQVEALEPGPLLNGAAVPGAQAATLGNGPVPVLPAAGSPSTPTSTTRQEQREGPDHAPSVTGATFGSVAAQPANDTKGSPLAAAAKSPEASADSRREVSDPAQVQRSGPNTEIRPAPASSSGLLAAAADTPPPSGTLPLAEDMTILTSASADRIVSSSVESTNMQARTTPGSPHQIARQIAEALPPMPDSPVEVSLSPEELGRVRLTLQTVDGGLSVVVQAERAETLDLMRRNIDSLARDFREMGYSNISFEFGSERGQNRSPAPQGNTLNSAESEPASRFNSATAALQPPEPMAKGGLDLRI